MDKHERDIRERNGTAVFLSLVALGIGVLIGWGVNTLLNRTTGGSLEGTPQFGVGGAPPSRTQVEETVKDWPEDPRNLVAVLTDKYGSRPKLHPAT